MHEYAITCQIVDIARSHAEAANAVRVNKINLVIGETLGYVGESIDLYFELIAKGTICEGAQLEIEQITSKLKCNSCGVLFDRKPFRFDCPICGGQGEPTEIGKEFYVKSIEIQREGDS